MHFAKKVNTNQYIRQKHIVKGSILEGLHFENLSPGSTMVGPTIDSKYERIPNILSVNSACKISKLTLL